MAVVGFPVRETLAYTGLQRQVVHKASHLTSHFAAFSKDQEARQPWTVQLSYTPGTAENNVSPAELMPLTATVDANCLSLEPWDTP